MVRLSKDRYYINIARDIYKRSTCLRRKYGAVIVNNDEIISTGYNGAPRGVSSCFEKGFCWREKNNIAHGSCYEKCFTVHAEQNAIISASRRDMLGSTLYISGENFDGSFCSSFPCVICVRMIINAGIEIVKYSSVDNTILTEYPQKNWKKEEFIVNYKG